MAPFVSPCLRYFPKILAFRVPFPSNSNFFIISLTPLPNARLFVSPRHMVLASKMSCFALPGLCNSIRYLAWTPITSLEYLRVSNQFHAITDGLLTYKLGFRWFLMWNPLQKTPSRLRSLTIVRVICTRNILSPCQHSSTLDSVYWNTPSKHGSKLKPKTSSPHEKSAIQRRPTECPWRCGRFAAEKNRASGASVCPTNRTRSHRKLASDDGELFRSQ